MNGGENELGDRRVPRLGKYTLTPGLQSWLWLQNRNSVSMFFSV